jgi:hypothetical protein
MKYNRAEKGGQKGGQKGGMGYSTWMREGRDCDREHPLLGQGRHFDDMAPTSRYLS